MQRTITSTIMVECATKVDVLIIILLCISNSLWMAPRCRIVSMIYILLCAFIGEYISGY